MDNPFVSDVRTSARNEDFIDRVQTVTDEFLQDNRDFKVVQDSRFAPDTVLAARVPYAAFLQYLTDRGLSFQEGMEVPTDDLMKWLRAKGYDDFITTDKRYDYR